MNIRTIATLAVAILLGLIAVLLVRNFLVSTQRPAAVATAGPTTPVVVASGPIARGQTLLPPVLKVAHYPTDSVPPGSFQSIAALGNARLAMRSMAPNEPILPDQITGPGGKLTLSVALTEGMRAVSLRSSDIAGVAGFVLPGDHVDILLTRTVGSGDNQTTVTQSLAENVLVMAIDQSANDESTTPAVPRAVTVEVTPAQAQMIYLAQAVGTVTLTLRHVADQAPLMRHATTVADLGYQPPRPRPPLAGGPPPLGRGQMLVRVTRGIDGSDYAVSRY